MSIPSTGKRLAEVDFPRAVVSQHSVREKSIRPGHPSTLHLRWLRQPLVACRATSMGLLLSVLVSSDDEANREFKRVLEFDEFGQASDLAREGLTRIVERAVRAGAVGDLRMDVVFYMMKALEAFEGMTPEQVQQVGFEAAMLGWRGLNLNKTEPKYTLRSLPGEYSALSVVSIMVAAFQQFAPGTDLGIDLAREYEAAVAMKG